MIQLAGRVFAILEEGHIVAHFLDLLPVNEALVLRGDHMGDFALLGRKIILDFMGSISGFSLDEKRTSVYYAIAVGHTGSIQLIVFEINLYVIGAEFQVFVFHHRIPEEIGIAAVQVIDGGVLGAVEDDGFHRVGRYAFGMLGNGITHNRIRPDRLPKINRRVLRLSNRPSPTHLLGCRNHRQETENEHHNQSPEI